MKKQSLHRQHTEDLLKLLQICAHKLLLAYDETLQPDLWDAFEKTAQACQMLAFDNKSYWPITFH